MFVSRLIRKSSASNLTWKQVYLFSTFNKFNAGVHMNPHPDKIQKGGEDAYSISKDGTLLSVADGVGGWANSGVDPALYSKRLCSIIDDLHE